MAAREGRLHGGGQESELNLEEMTDLGHGEYRWVERVKGHPMIH